MGRRSRAQPDGDLPYEGRGSGASPASGRQREERFGFALVIAALSTVAALALFFTSTVPAMQEQRFLRDIEADRVQLHQELWTELENETNTQAALAVDIQGLLVELDRRGVFPADLLPAPEPPASGPVHPANGVAAPGSPSTGPTGEFPR